MQNRITAHLPVDGLLFWKMSGTEALSESFALSVTLLGTDARIDRSRLLGHPITLCIPAQHLPEPRFINGKITRVSVSPVELSGTRYAAYKLTVESDLWPMMRDKNQRIFQEQTVPQIVKTLLSEYQVNVEDRLSESYRIWEYCVQYQESSYAFICRLMEQEGISFHFRHEQDRHRLVLTDAPHQFKKFPGYQTIPYHQTLSGGTTSAEGIGQWTMEDIATPGLYSTDDYDFRKPNAWLLQARQNPASPSPGNIDVYDWPGRFVEHSHGEYYARIRQQRWQVEHQKIQATATATGVAPGNSFALYNAPFASDNGEYLTVAAAYDFEENPSSSGGSEAKHNIDMTVIPADLPYRPAATTEWPRTYGPQTARVVAPEGESIWTDKYGRVKVKFHWDRMSRGDETSSCWVRVSSAWAGQGFGGVQIPRAGDEVVVDFINGDPDRPIITGRVYNEASMPPWALPAAATQMGFISRSKDGSIDNANALRFEDKAGAEQIWLHAERNMDTEIEGDETHIVEGNRYKRVDGNETSEIGGNRTETVSGNETITISGNRTEEVNGNETITVHGVRSETVDGNEDITLKSDQKITVLGSRTEQVDVDETITVKGNRTEKVIGNEDIEIDGSKTQIIKSGEELTITAGGQKEIINGEVKQKVTGDFTQEIIGNNKINVKGNMDITVKDGNYTLFSPMEITIKSSTKVNITAPEVDANGTNFWNSNDTEFNTIKLISISHNDGLNASLNNISFEANLLKFDFTPIDVCFNEGGIALNLFGAEIKNKKLKFATAAIHFIS